MAPAKEQDFRGVSLKRELVEEIEQFIRDFPRYKNKADFVHEAVRIRMEQIRQVQLRRPLLTHENLNEDGVRIHDRIIKQYVDIAFKPQGIKCGYCGTNDCYHIQFALSVPEIQAVIRKKRAEGWELPNL